MSGRRRPPPPPNSNHNHNNSPSSGDYDDDDEHDDDSHLNLPPPSASRRSTNHSNNNPNDNNSNNNSTTTPRRWTAERLLRASYQDLGSPSQVKARFLDHLLSVSRDSILELLQQKSRNSRDYSLPVNAFSLLAHDPILGHLALRYPATLLPLLEQAIVQAQVELQRQCLEEYNEKNDHNNENQSNENEINMNSSNNPANWIVKGSASNNHNNHKGTTRVHARLVHLPPFCCRTSVAQMDASDVGKIVQVSGTVVRAGPVQMYESARTYQCCGKKGCHKTFLQYADLEQRTNALQPPDRCPNLLPNGTRCVGTNLQLQPEGSVHTDYQELKIQEAASNIGMGTIPRSLLIKLQHDLVDQCQPGDEVVVVGSLLAQWPQHSLQEQVDCQITLALSAHSIRVVQENGASAWNSNNNNNGNAGSSVGALDKFRQEFDAFWNHQQEQQNPIQARDFICQAVCPKLYGLHIIKLSLLITLIGGVSSEAFQQQQQQQSQPQAQDEAQDEPSQGNDDSVETPAPTTRTILTQGAPEPFRVHPADTSTSTPTQAAFYERSSISTTTDEQQSQRTTTTNTQNHPQEAAVQTRRRDMSHILLVGDPGTGKSQILRFAAALCPRSVLTTGVGTTSAGLTCAAVREGSGKEFALEAGALVLADKGVCCIDEFGCIRNEDRTTIHEAMEQQTLSVAKAGIVCKLNCRATIVAVMNPRDCIYDNHASLSHNTGLGTPLLSRFDLIFKLVDTSDAERDGNVTTYLLNRAIQGAGFECAAASASASNGQIEELPWSLEKLRAYISIVKEQFQPELSEEAALLLERHYEKIRSAHHSSVIPVTVRFLESLIRLSQAHARLMYRNTVVLQDAVAVIRVMECSAFAYGGFDGNVDDVENVLYRDPMTMDVSNHNCTPDEDFLMFEYQILSRYGMLDYLDTDRRNRAVQLFGGTTSGADGQMVPQTPGWGAMEDTRDRSSIVHDHYGRFYFNTPSGSSQGSANKRSKFF